MANFVISETTDVTKKTFSAGIFTFTAVLMAPSFFLRLNDMTHTLRFGRACQICLPLKPTSDQLLYDVPGSNVGTRIVGGQ